MVCACEEACVRYPDDSVCSQVLFNVLFPDWLQTALLTVLLLFVINKTVRKGVRQWNQESKAIKQRHQDNEEASPACLPPIPWLG